MFNINILSKTGLLLSMILLSGCGDSLEEKAPSDWNPDSGDVEDPDKELSEKAASGEMLYGAEGFNCIACHGVQGTNQIFPLDATRGSYSHSSEASVALNLDEYINQWMIKESDDISICLDDCGDELAEYIRSWNDDSTDPDDGSEDPSDGGTDPGDGSTDPDDGGTDPGDGNTDPDDGETDPGEVEANPSGKNASITDTSTLTSGRLNYRLSDNNISNLTAGAVSVDVLYPADETNDFSIALYDSSNSTDATIADIIFKADGRIQLRDTQQVSGSDKITLSETHQPGEWTNVQIAWDKSANSYSLYIDGALLGAYDFNNLNADAVASFGLKLASNSKTSSYAISVDNLSIYADSAMNTVLFSDTFETYSLDEALDGINDPYDGTSTSVSGTPLDGGSEPEPDVNNPPMAVATSDVTSGDIPLIVSFDASGSFDTEDSTLSYLWDFGDGSSSTLEMPVKEFSAAGNYAVTLVVTDSENASTVANVINITATSPMVDLPPVAEISKDVTSGEVPLTVSFDASRSSDDNSIVAYNWDFGDGSASVSGVTVSHTYNTVGDYTATLTVTDSAGNSTQSTTQINVAAVIDLAPIAAFTMSSSTGEAPLMLSFDASTSSDDNAISSYRWDFGDGSASASGVSTSYTYSEAGIYTVALTVTDSNQQTHTVTRSVTVTASLTQEELIALGQNYYEQSALGCVLCHGDSGDGAYAVDASKESYYHDDQPSTALTLEQYIDTYMPTLSLSPSLCTGECAESIAAYIRSWDPDNEVNQPPVAVATSNVTSGEQPLTVTFDGAGSSDAEDSNLSYLWDFGDGTSSTLASPTKVFNSAGNYSVTLVVTDTDNASTAAEAINIAVTSPMVDLPPVAHISENVSAGELPLTVDFDASASSDDIAIASYSWNFGDGSALAYGVTASHTYTQEGDYTATLTVTDSAGQTAQTTTQITVEAVVDLVPVAAFTMSSSSGEAPLVVSFDASTASDDNAITAYAWDFANGSAVASGVSAVYTFTEAGSYEVTLTVTDASNQTHFVTETVTVTSGSDGGTDPGDGSNPGDGEEIVGDPVLGEALYESFSCDGCHGETGTAPISAFPDIDKDKTSFSHSSDLDVTYNLSDYIQTWMPPNNEGACDAQCAADIVSYIESWEEDLIITCNAEGVSYGRRQMRLLTTREYENTLQDLLGYSIDAADAGIPADTLVENFANQVLTSVTQDYMDAYTAVAADAASFAAENGFAAVADCSDSSSSECAELFINDFAYKAYRRPLTDDEADRYRDIFTGSISGGSTDNALTIAVQSVLSSPYFLYRSEMGESIIDIRDRIENGTGEYEQGDTSLTLEGASLGVDEGSYKDIALYQNWGDSIPDYTFTGNDLVTIVATGVADGDLPSIKLSVDNQHIETRILSSATETTYSFTVTGVVGSYKYVQIINDINGSTHSESRLLSIKSITFSDAVEVEEEAPSVELDDDAYVLTSYEVATFIAYTYTGSMPDAELLQAAAENALSTPEEIQVHIDRLMATDKAREHFGEFAAEWLDVDGVLSSSKSAELFPTFTQEVRVDMAQEVREIFKHVMFDDDQDISNIYGNFSFMNKNLADFYGISGPTSDTFVKVDNLDTRGGILTSGAFMANYAHDEETSPIKRGVAVREDLLCQEVPPMPTDITAEREAAQAALAEYLEENDSLITNAEYYGFITKDAPCSDCHEEIINPHSFGMEDFDPVGLIREYGTNGKAIDATGQLIGTETLTDGNVLGFHGARELSNELQKLPAAKTCFTEKSFRFVMAIGHEVYDSDSDDSPELSDQEKSDYTCAIESMAQSMSLSGNNAKAAFKAIGLSDIVLYRKQQ